MKYGKLGNTGITVSKLAFGTLTMGPLQRNMSVSEGAPLIREALERGITFVDGAQMYGTYGHIRAALKGFNKDVVITSKSAAKSYDDMAKAVEEAQKELNRDVIDVFLMHAVQQDDDLAVRQQGAWQCLQKMKAKGIVRAIGLSTHNIDIVETVASWPELDVIHPIFNKVHFGLINPNNKDPEQVIRKAHERGIGMYAMKPLAGGHLYQDAIKALRYAFDFPYIHAVAIGMVKKEELDVNLKIFDGEDVSDAELKAAASNKRMYVLSFCKGCGNCLDACEQGAISMVDEKAYIEHSNCILCGYCRKSCPHSFIRII